MSTLNQVSPDWLVVRAAVDARTRSTGLVEQLADILPPGPQVVHDLGSGTGAMMRWLAPQLSGPQHWVLHDGDPGILEHRDPDPVLDAGGRAVIIRTSVEHIADLDTAAIDGATLVVASALLDVITAGEASTIIDACIAVGAPVLFSLTVAGRVEFDPPHEADQVFATAFNAHQRRTADGRSLLGPDAVGAVKQLLRAAGWHVRTVGTPWDLTSLDGVLIVEWLDGWLAAAVEQEPALRELADEYRANRGRQLAAGALRVVVHHRDVLAWPA